ncbi:MAG TPA: CHAD domain-containing protein, partial [Stellaceae bacterium]|nr:CHAD domain-containing protein [Stellaceae bacterium]
ARETGGARALPMARRAKSSVGSLVERARKRGRRLMRQDVAGLHRLRKAVRRLRYGLLFLAPLLPGRGARPLARAVEALQETLGAVNDCAVGKELIGLARAKAHGPQRRKTRKLLLKRLKAARAARRRELEAQWEAFRTARARWDAAR